MKYVAESTLRLSAALQFAVEKHTQAQQTREDRITPYWVHPFRVAERLRMIGINDCELLCAAYLHDTVEDTDTTIDDLEKLFGKRVSQLVADVSQGASQSLSDYHAQIRNSSSDSQTLKLADKLDNVNELLRMKYATYGKQSPQDYLHDAENTLSACSDGDPNLKELLRLEIDVAKKQFNV